MSSPRDKFGDPMSPSLNALERNAEEANFDADPETLRAILLPDANDLHVVAIAVAAHANCICHLQRATFPRSGSRSAWAPR
jgi:hypothetical protein